MVVKTICGCWIQTSHKLNQDEYFRIQAAGVEGASDKGLIMFHRLMWQHANGRVVPEGYDLDHKCHNRACFNPAHLRLFKHGDHQADNNSKRYRIGGKLSTPIKTRHKE
jgi:hypothetical protein